MALYCTTILRHTRLLNLHGKLAKTSIITHIHGNSGASMSKFYSWDSIREEITLDEVIEANCDLRSSLTCICIRNILISQ